MPDLEDQFFKSNVPGRYSAWDDGGGDGDGDGDGDGGGQDDTVPDTYSAPTPGSGTAASGPPTALNRLEATPSHNTGAKGVLADHRAAKEEEAYRRQVEKIEKEAILDRAVRGAQLRPGEVSISAAAVEERRRAENISRRNRDAECDDSDGSASSGDDSDGDDDFMRSYRQKRLLQMKNEAVAMQQQHCITTSRSSTQYGEIEEVTPIQYAEAVDETDQSTALVVHLFEPYISACSDVNNHLETLAQVMPSVRFIRLRATEARPGFDPIGLPSVLVYLGGRLLQNLTPVTEHLPDRFTAEDMRVLLESCACGGPGEKHQNAAGHTIATTLQNGTGVGEDYDSDDAELDDYCADFAG